MSGTHDQPAREQAGFTLIELLITLALLSLLSVALFGGLRFGARATDRTNATLDRTAQLSLAYGFLQAQIGNAQPFPASAAPQEREIIFDGAPDRLDLISTAPAALTAGGFFRLNLVAAREGDEVRLIGRWQNAPRRANGLPEPALPPAVLLDHLKAIRFAYFGRSSRDDPAEWHDTWRAASVLPKMIRMRVEFSDGWQSPDLIVAPRLAEDPSADG